MINYVWGSFTDCFVSSALHPGENCLPLCYYVVIKASCPHRCQSPCRLGAERRELVSPQECSSPGSEREDKQTEPGGAFKAARSRADIDLRARSDHIHKRFGEENVLRLLLCLLV